MKQVGSARIETLEEARYELSRFTGDGSVILYNKDTQNLEAFVIRDTLISGWQIEMNGKYLEFCGDAD